MTGETTLVAVTRSVGRPTGPRGEPLHNVSPQLRRVVRRRLGNAAADLLAEPRVRSDGLSIEWFADWPGDVRPLTEIEGGRRAALLARVELAMADIRRLGEALTGKGSVDDTGSVGRALQLAGRLPDQSVVYMVGDKPVVIAWGYDKGAVAGLQPTLPGRTAVPPRPPPAAAAPTVAAAPLPGAPSRPVLQAPVALGTAPIVSRSLARTGERRAPLGGAFLAGVPLVLLVLGAAWLLREHIPGLADLNMALHEATAPPAAASRPDPLPLLRASLSSEQERQKTLRVELASLEDDLKKRAAQCKPKEEPKPPQVAIAPSPPKPAPEPPKPKPQPQQRPGDDRLRLPSEPTNNYSFLQGCWRTDPFRHELMQAQAGVSSYCFDASGNGQLEWRRGNTACRTRAHARFEGNVLRLRDADTTCNDGSNWYADQLVCQRGADNVANCSGSSRGAFGPVNWTVNLHKLQ